jgi:hypothetical protein
MFTPSERQGIHKLSVGTSSSTRPASAPAAASAPPSVATPATPSIFLVVDIGPFLIVGTAASTGETEPAPAPFTVLTWSASSFPRLRFIDFQDLSVKILAIQTGYGGGRLILIGHLDKGKTSRFARLAICDDLAGAHLPERLDFSTQFLFRSFEGQIPNENVHHNLIPFLGDKRR